MRVLEITPTHGLLSKKNMSHEDMFNRFTGLCRSGEWVSGPAKAYVLRANKENNYFIFFTHVHAMVGDVVSTIAKQAAKAVSNAINTHVKGRP